MAAKDIQKYKFPKGKSGNPKGRPPVLKPLKEVIEKVMADEKDGVSAMEAVVMTLRSRALKGDTKAIDLLLSYTYGKPKQSVDVTTDGEKISNMPYIIIQRK